MGWKVLSFPRGARRRGRSLIETLVVVSGLFLLASLVGMGVSRSLQSTRTMQCAANLRQIHQAMLIYSEEHQSFPVLTENQTLQDVLNPPLGNPTQLFHCPQDANASGDSYSYFYAPRPVDTDWDSYLLGCPRHQKYARGVAVFTDNHIETSKTDLILHDGTPIRAGVEFDYGTFHFADGSEASISNGASANASPAKNNGHAPTPSAAPDRPVLSALISYRRSDGAYHTVLKMKEGKHGTAAFTVVPGNRFEVVTPAGVIAVRGTRFSITTLQQGGKPATRVKVTSGVVELASVSKGKPLKLTATPGNDQGFVVQGEAPQLE